MALSFRFIPPEPRSVLSGEIFSVIIELNWLVTDTAPPANQWLNITLPIPQPTPVGIATLLNPAGPAPVLASPLQGSFVAATATTEGSLRYIVALRAGNIGNVRFNVSLASPVSANYDLVIT
ncbi:hypothetical protein [Rhizobiales bacterium]|uniref:hypothetical protein n=1 Tax=Pseudochrobactrum asaccharolyticum TaxID=354351 RepID=UPI0013CE7020